MASSLGIADHVILTGQIPNEELPDYHRLADVFVMPGLKEGFGIVFLEAMASGKPVIAGNRDGSFDALDGGRLGALIDPFNAAQLAETADALLSHQHPNPLLSNPAALHDAVTAQFGFKRVASLMVDNLTPWVTPDRTPVPSSPPQPPPPPPVHSSVRIVVVTEFTSPYQIEFFNAIARQGTVLLEVIYMTGQDSTRLWERSPMGHLNWVLTDNQDHHWEASKSVKDADLVIFNTYLFSFALPALWKRARSGKPWAFWGERPGSLNTGRKGRLMRKILLHPLHRQPVPIWGMGQFGIQGYQAEYGSQRAYHNLPYASNLQRFFDLPDRSPSDRVFLFSGRFTERKGADLIAIAFARIAAKHPNAKLILVGSGPLESSMRASLAPCASQVEWLGFQPWTEMPAALAKGTILCLPSRYDGWGLALVEGLAAGMPAIGTDKTGSAVELLSDQQAGWLIPANNADALAKIMEQALLIDDPSFHAKQRAARAATQSLDVNQAASRFLTLCHLAMGETNRP
jgi:glycosyltransferase involved in cell wall biosynthesis